MWNYQNENCVGEGFRGIQITSGFFQIWRASGITSELQLYCTAIGVLVFAALMLFAGWFHYHKAGFQDVESLLFVLFVYARYHKHNHSIFWIGERWLSGLKRRIANPLYAFLYREFESLSFRLLMIWHFFFWTYGIFFFYCSLFLSFLTSSFWKIDRKTKNISKSRTSKEKKKDFLILHVQDYVPNH